MEMSSPDAENPKIQHLKPGFSRPPQDRAAPATAPPGPSDDDPLPVAKSVGPTSASKQIRAFGKSRRHE